VKLFQVPSDKLISCSRFQFACVRSLRSKSVTSVVG